MAFGMDGLDWALAGASLARVAAFAVTPEPVEHPEARRNREGRAERAQITAEYTLNRQVAGQERPCIEHERPASHETKDDRCLERLHLGGLFRGRERAQRYPEQNQKDYVFQRREPLVHAEWDPQLRDFQDAAEFD